MFKSFSPSGSRSESGSAIHTLLGSESQFRGEVVCGPQALRVEGHFEGTIRAEGEVTVAAMGSIVGTIQARHLVIAGRVEGILKVEGCLEIQGTGWVEGEVEVGSLIVDEGGTFQGSCTKRGAAKEAAAPPPPAPNTQPLQRLPQGPGQAAGGADFPVPRGLQRP